MPSASSELKLERAVNELKQRTLFQRDLDSVEKWAAPPHSQWEKGISSFHFDTGMEQ